MWTVQLYTDWVNDCLQKTNCARRVTNLQTDLADSHLLGRLVEAVGMAARLAYLFTPARTVTIHCWVRFGGQMCATVVFGDGQVSNVLHSLPYRPCIDVRCARCI